MSSKWIFQNDILHVISLTFASYSKRHFPLEKFQASNRICTHTHTHRSELMSFIWLSIVHTGESFSLWYKFSVRSLALALFILSACAYVCAHIKLWTFRNASTAHTCVSYVRLSHMYVCVQYAVHTPNMSAKPEYRTSRNLDFSLKRLVKWIII